MFRFAFLLIALSFTQSQAPYASYVAERVLAKPLSQKVKKAKEQAVLALKCTEIIALTEKKYGIPAGLLQAIAHIESRCHPYAVHANGRGLRFKNAKSAVEFIQITSGNVNIGCMQLDVRSHKNRFRDFHMMIHPENNINFAGKLLKKLHRRFGTWERAIAFYHSASPVAQKRYVKAVLNKWARTKGRSAIEQHVTYTETL